MKQDLNHYSFRSVKNLNWEWFIYLFIFLMEIDLNNCRVVYVLWQNYYYCLNLYFEGSEYWQDIISLFFQ